VTGALLHDIGKVASYSADPMAPGFTDAGRLHGEIVIGHDIVRGLIDETPGFPDEMAAQLRHIVVSHHGEREKGSPVVPATREAVIVHYCDDMTARLAAVDEIAARTADGARWSAWCNMLDGYTYLAEAADSAPTPALAPSEPVGDELVVDEVAADVAAELAVDALDADELATDEPVGDGTSSDDDRTGAALF
jgi:3'-5' exoribonuclease